MATSALAVHVRGFDASLVGEGELREHFESVGLVDSVKIFALRAPGIPRREHGMALVTYFTEFTQLARWPNCTIRLSARFRKGCTRCV